MAQSNNLRMWREGAGLTMEQLAEKLGISVPSVSRIESGVQQPRPALLRAICDLFGVKKEGEFYGAGDTPDPWVIGARRIPVVDYVQAGQFVGVDLPHRDLEMQEYLLTDGDYSKDAFALKIRGDSMAPYFQEGDTIIVDPAIPPHPNDFVVATNGGGDATFKQYKDRGLSGGRQVFEIVPLNDGYPSLRSDSEEVQIIGTMVEHRQYRRLRPKAATALTVPFHLRRLLPPEK